MTPWPRPGLFAALVAGSALGAVLFTSPLLAISPPLSAIGWWHRAAIVDRRRQRYTLAAEIPVFVDELIQRLKAGTSLAAALRSPNLAPEGTGSPRPSPLSDALAPLRAQLAGGVRLGAALDEVADRAGPGVDLLLGTLRVLVARGGPALPSLERLSDTLRTAQGLHDEARAQAGQATASAAALTGLPALFVVIMALVDHRLAGFYLHHPIGAGCAVTAGVLSHLGWWWMDRLIGDHR